MSQVILNRPRPSTLRAFESYPKMLNPYGSYPLTRNLNPPGMGFHSYPLTRNLNPPGMGFHSFPLTGNLNPMGDWSSALGGVVSLVGGLLGGGGGAGGAGGGKVGGTTTIINTPPPQPAPPVPFNWTPVIVSGGVVLIALTLIMTASKR